MRLYQEDNRYIFACTFEDRDIPKDAGFKPEWVDGKFKYWFTEDKSKAALLVQFADNGIKSELRAIIEEQRTLVSASSAVDADIDIPVPDGMELRGYQKGGVAYGARIYRAGTGVKGVLIGDEMGLGKSAQSLALINLLKFKRTLIIVPASLKINWHRECNMWLTDESLRSRILIADTKTPKPLIGQYPLVITNYDSLRAHMTMSKGKKPRVQDLGGFDVDWDYIICDEAHLIKSSTSQRSKFTRALIKRAKFAAMLTGTPIVNRPIELWPIISSIAPTVFNNWWEFANRFCGAEQTRFGLKTSGATDTEGLQSLLRRTCMVRRLKRDVLKELPPKIRQVVEIQPDEAKLKFQVAAQRADWESTQQRIVDLRVELEISKASNDPSDYQRIKGLLAQQNSFSFEALSRGRHDLARQKVPYVIRHIHELIDEDPEYKVVVFAHHLDVIEAIAEEFGRKAVTITGSVSSKTKTVNGKETSDRQERVDRFQNDPSVQLIIGEFTPMGTGWTLTASSHVVFAELDWVPGICLQCEDRCHRLSQTDSVLVQYLVLEGSLDLIMAQTLIAKQSVIEKALNPEDLEAEGKDERLVPIVEASTKSLSRDKLSLIAGQVSRDITRAVSLGLQELLQVSAFRANVIDEKVANAIWPLLPAPRAAGLGQALALCYRRSLSPELVAVLDPKGE